MSAMEKMLANILKDMLPPEVLAVATKENIEKIIGAAKDLKESLEQGMRVIQDEQASQRAMLEELLNDLDGDTGKPGNNTGSDGGTTKRFREPATSK